MTRKTWLAAVFFTAATVWAKSPHKLAKDLNEIDPQTMVNVIVQFRSDVTERHLDKGRNRGGTVLANLHQIRGAAMRLSSAAISELSDDEDVAYISPDRPLSGATNIERQSVGAAYAQSIGWTGTGIGIAVIDSGVDGMDGMVLGKSVVYEQNFVYGTSSAKDQYGHGTHVAGIIAGTGAISRGFYQGLAIGAKIINLRVLDANARGSDSQAIAAIQRAIDLKSTYNIRIINLSLGRPVFESYTLDPLCQAVEKAWKAGIVVVVAAGNAGRNNTYNNNGYGTISSPGNDPYVITVGALKSAGTVSRSDERVASYSSKGPTLLDHVVKPDIMAPGNRVISVKLNANSVMESQYPANEVNNDYFILSGSSMATPMVSAAAAILLQKQPGLTPDQVKARLMKTASKDFPASSIATDPITKASYTSYYDIFTIGAGYLNIQAALSNNDTLTGNALSPKVVYNAVTRNGNLSFAAGSGIGGVNVVWGENVVWGNNVVWGDNVVWGTNVVWGDSIVWGGSTNAFSILWGTNVFWGASTQTEAETTSLTINGEN